ncbi:hypothetical protein GQ457_16G005930 [Hibiscus cannabinus]
MLNQVALLRSASSRSSSSRFLFNSLSSGGAGYKSSSNFSEESCMFHGSHQSTLDELYAWEKKTLRLDKTRAALRDLHTQIKVSIHSVEAISKRIQTLRDEELQPQLLELVRGLTRMWKVMAECHQAQKWTVDVAKVFLPVAGAPSKLEAKLHPFISAAEPHRLALQLRISKQTSELESLFSVMDSFSATVFACSKRLVPPLLEVRPRYIEAVLFTSSFHWNGVSLWTATKRGILVNPVGSKRFAPGLSEELRKRMDLVKVHEVETVMTAEKQAAVSIRVLFAGMSIATCNEFTE